LWSRVVGVGQLAAATTSSSRPFGLRGGNFTWFVAPCDALIVGHDPHALADVRGIDGTSRNLNRRDEPLAPFAGVVPKSETFQLSKNPRLAVARLLRPAGRAPPRR
jgi:hypothetical protein